MISALALSALLVMGAPGSKPGALKFQAGQTEFKRGDFLGALRILDGAAAEATEDQLLGQIHLLRGQCLAARQDFPGAEEAFGLALRHDPEVRLDPSKVDPAVVTMLDSQRSRLRGSLIVSADRPGAQVWMDGKQIGQTPLKSSVPIGTHSLEVRTPDRRFAQHQEVTVRARQSTEVHAELKQQAAPLSSGKSDGASEATRPFADIRGTLDPFRSGDNVGFEVGGGLEYQHFRGSVSAVLFPDFGVNFRGALSVPVVDSFNAYISVEMPIIFASPVQFGLGGAGGLEYEFTRWFDPFFEVGVRHLFTGQGNDDANRFILQFGIRLKVP
ncbi:MAG TPA: PEGA domain-containing protein [Myxococcaceae bacterium]|nr:PEGA domain-containing protein [Myxococcaceae bacterium]